MHKMRVERECSRRGSIQAAMMQVAARGKTEAVKGPRKACVAVRTPTLSIPSRSCRERVSRRITRRLERLVSLKQRRSVLIMNLKGRRVATSSLNPHTISGLRVAERIVQRCKLGDGRRVGVRRVDKVIPNIVTRAKVRALRVIQNIISRAGPSLIVTMSTLTTEDATELGQAVRVASAKVDPNSNIKGRERNLGRRGLSIHIVKVNIPAIISTTAVIRSSVTRLLRTLRRSRRGRFLRRVVSPGLCAVFMAPGSISRAMQCLDFAVSRKLGLTFSSDLVRRSESWGAVENSH